MKVNLIDTTVNSGGTKMNRIKLVAWMFLSLLICVAAISAGSMAGKARPVAAFNQPGNQPGGQLKSSDINFIAAEELKAKVARNEPVTIIDVRSNETYIDSGNTIKGSIHVNPRKLNSRLAFPPLKNIAHESEVVTYCACPNDESAIRAAQVLLGAGFTRVRVLKGGWRMWLQVNGPVTPKPK